MMKYNHVPLCVVQNCKNYIHTVLGVLDLSSIALYSQVV